MASNPNNPVYNDIFNSPNKVLFENKPNFIRPKKKKKICVFTIV